MSLFNIKRLTTATLRQTALGLILVCCLIITNSIIEWANEIEMRPMLMDVRVADSVKIVDVLDQHAIAYYLDLAGHILYVESAKKDQARVALARVGIVIEYPPFTPLPVFSAFSVEQTTDDQQPKPFYEQEGFLKIFRSAIAGLVVMMLIFSVARPALRALISPDDNNK